MKLFEEFCDVEYTGQAIEKLNSYIENNPHYEIKVVGYSVVHYEGINKERTYILASVKKPGRERGN